MAIKKITQIVCVCLIVLFSGMAGAHSLYSCKVHKVVDGDTFDCLLKIDDYFKLYQDVRIRLRYVNAPEMSSGQLGQEAKQSLTDLVQSKDITLSSLEKDKYGRVAAEVRIGTTYVNEAMVIARHATVPPYVTGAEATRLRKIQNDLPPLQ